MYIPNNLRNILIILVVFLCRKKLYILNNLKNVFLLFLVYHELVKWSSSAENSVGKVRTIALVSIETTRFSLKVHQSNCVSVSIMIIFLVLLRSQYFFVGKGGYFLMVTKPSHLPLTSHI